MIRSISRYAIVRLAWAVLLAIIVSGPALASVARVEFSIGEVIGVGGDGKERPLVKGSVLLAGDTVRTERGRAQIRFTDGGYTSLQPNTEFRIDDYHYDAKSTQESVGFFSLLKGGLRTITGVIGRLRKKAYQLRTPVATVGIRGTEYLAELGSSLTVHVGEGEIEVCSNVTCRSFSSRQTGYVASGGSTPTLAEHPPSLAPPQEFQVYRYTGEYQAQFDEGAQFSASDLILGEGTVLADGPFYALAVSWGENASIADIFAAPPPGSTGPLTDATFDASGGLLSYTNGATRVPIAGSVGTASIVEAGVAGPVGWGRWTGGSATAGTSTGGSTPVSLSGSSSHHYAIGLPTPVLPTNPATYSLLGATSPTLASGSGAPGTLNSADLAADFAKGNVVLNMDMTVAGVGYQTRNLSMNVGSNAVFSGAGTTTNATNCVSVGCTTDVEGFFAGDDASHAGLTYKTSIPGDFINGAAAFTKD